MLSSLPSHLRAQSASETVWALGRVGRGADGRTASRKSATEPGVKAPTTIETPRLILRRPEAGDINAMFARYASDPVVTRYLGWATHHAVDETQAFLALSDAEWERWPGWTVSDLLTCRRRSPWRHRPGVRDPAPRVNRLRARLRCLGSRYATETLQAIVETAHAAGVQRLYALCHPDHRPSRRVLEKCDFQLKGTLRRHTEFPNLRRGVVLDVLCSASILGD